MAESPNIRWMIRADMPSVLAIESQCFSRPWSEADFIRRLRQRNCIGMVAKQGDWVAGFMVFEFHKNKLRLANLAVAVESRRIGIGRSMIEKLRGKLSRDRRDRIVLEVLETNLRAQLFFKALGFRATQVLRDFYEDTEDDAYEMVYRIDSPVPQEMKA